MSSDDNAKKRKFAGLCGDEGGTSGADADGTVALAPRDTLAEMKAMMDGMCSRMEMMSDQMEVMENQHQTEMERMKREHSKLRSDLSSVERRCRFLETKCGSLERSAVILMRNQYEYFEYPAPEIVKLQLRVNGYDEDRADQLVSMAYDLKSTTCQIRRGESWKELSLGVENGSVAHDELLRRHWREFADAVQIYNGFDGIFSTLSIRNVELPHYVLKWLALAMEGKDIGQLVLENVADGINGLLFAASMVKNNPSLKYLDWKSNNIGNNVVGVDLLLSHIADHPSIECLSLDNCFHGTAHGYGVLRSLLAKAGSSLVRIDFNSNSVQTRGATHLANFIATNPPLASGTVTLEKQSSP